MGAVDLAVDMRAPQPLAGVGGPGPSAGKNPNHAAA